MFLLTEVGEPVHREENWVPAEPPSQGQQHGAGLPFGDPVERRGSPGLSEEPSSSLAHAHTHNPSFKTYTREKTLSTILFTSSHQQRHFPSQSALQISRQGLKQQKVSIQFSDALKINPAVPISIQEGQLCPLHLPGNGCKDNLM